MLSIRVLCPALQQSKIAAAFDRVRVFDSDDALSAKITKSITEMMALNNLPFNLINNEGFCRLTNHLKPR